MNQNGIFTKFQFPIRCYSLLLFDDSKQETTWWWWLDKKKEAKVAERVVSPKGFTANKKEMYFFYKRVLGHIP